MMPYYSIAAQLLVHAILYRYSAWQIGELPQVPGDGSQGNRVGAAPKSVHCQWSVGDPLIGARSGLTTVTSTALSWLLVQKGIKAGGKLVLSLAQVQPAQLFGRVPP